MSDIVNLIELLNTTEGLLGGFFLSILILGTITKYFNLNKVIKNYFKKKKDYTPYVRCLKVMGNYSDKLTALRGSTKASAILIYQLMNGEKFLSGNPEIKARLVLQSSESSFRLPAFMNQMSMNVLTSCIQDLNNKERIHLEVDYPHAITNLVDSNPNEYDKFIKVSGVEGALTVGLQNEFGLSYILAVSLYEGSDCNIDGNPLDKRADEVYNFLQALDLDLKNNK